MRTRTLSNPNMSRRAFGAGIVVTAVATFLPRPGLSLTNQEATNLIGRLVADLNGIINSGKPEKAMYRDFEALLVRYGDIPIIARSSMGVAWRRASASQRSRYTKAFQGYLARKYGARFREFVGGKIVVNGSKKVKSGYLVSSTAHLQGQAPFALDWQVSDKSGQNRMFNMYIEGISLLATERTEVGAMLDQSGGNIDEMIDAINKAG